MILTLIFIAVFASVGFQFAIEPGMILNFYRRFLAGIMRKSDYGWLLAKPLGLCITCHSHWVAFILMYNNFEAFRQQTTLGSWVLLEFACIAVSGISTMLWFFYNTIKEA